MKTTSLQIWTPFTLDDYGQCYFSRVIPYQHTERISLRRFFSSQGVRLLPLSGVRCSVGIKRYQIIIPGYAKPQLLFVSKVRV